MSESPNRREFVSSMAAGATLFHIVPRHVLGRGYRAPSDTLNIACIGVGGMGRNDVRGMEGENLVALCDVDWNAADDAFRSYPKARRYKDYRDMLEREAKNIDAVTISTPDHSHTAAAMLALKAGKHVYCQKPLARTLGEVRALMQEAARRPKQCTQMGNQGHTLEGCRQIREWVEAGVIGPVREVHYWTNRPIWAQGVDRPTALHVPPPTLDWNLWLGPAPSAPTIRPTRRSAGAAGGTSAPGRWATWPATGWTRPSGPWISTIRRRSFPRPPSCIPRSAPKSSRVEYRFPARNGRGEVKVVWRDGGLWPPRPEGLPAGLDWPPEEIGGQMWMGDSGAILAGMYGENPRLLDSKRDAELKASPPPQKYERSPGVYAEWIRAMKGGAPNLSTFAGHAGPLTEMVLLGCVAVRQGQPIDIDAEKGNVTTSVPGEWIAPSYRKGWSL